MASGIRLVCAFATLSWAGLLSGEPQSAADKVQETSRANALIEAGKPEQAISIYKQLSAAFPNELSLRINLAVALYKAGRYRETIDECNAVLKRQPDLFPAWLFLGASHLRLNDASSAEGPLRKALAIRGSDPNARIMLADVLLARGKWAEAAEQYEVSARAMPDSARVWYGLNRSYESLARDLLTRLETEAPRSPETLALTAELELESAQIAEAFQHFRQALSLQPSFRGIHTLVAGIYQATGHPDWAAVERQKENGEGKCDAADSLECEFAAGRLREVASAKADSPAAIYWQANAFLDLSRQAYSRLQALPPSREGYEAAAQAEEKRGRYPEAAAAWKKALQMEPDNARLQRQLALALCHGNDCVSALPLLKEQLVRDPSSVELNYLCGLALNSVRNPAQAIPYLENAVRLDATFRPARAVLGEAYLEAGKPERAIPNLKAALAEDESGSRHYQLARAYQAAGMRDRSVEVLREYREIAGRRKAGQLTESSITPP